MPIADDLSPREHARLEADAALHGFKLEGIHAPGWITFALSQKEMFVKRCPELPAMPPAVLAMRDGAPAAIVIAPQVDAKLGLRAAHLLHCALDPDELYVCFEVFGQKDPGPLQPGQLQRLREAGYQCELNPIVDALIAFRVGRGGELDSGRLPFLPPEGPKPLAWFINEFSWTGEPARPSEGAHVFSGRLSDALRAIRQEPVTIDSAAYRELAAVAQKLDYSRERQILHTARAAMHLLDTEGYIVIDLLSERHAEWLGPDARPIGAPEEG